MTEGTTTPDTGAESNADGPEGLPEGTDTGEQQDGSESPGSKEARYRIRAREAETALAEAQSRIEAMNRRELERLAGEAGLSHPTDLLTLSANEISDYLTEDGEIDPEKVAADVEAILTERPGLKKARRYVDPTQGLGGKVPMPKKPSWGSLLG
ncbi:hypothetical protein [Mycolicibacterium psychrotolerans]|uniref:Uncharacterized protein n=1 Tax=Mycolicibacterium psychrotolerans TaxID=216929 RepID=A0A7I7MC68_9MYCO|nr:hypothetical protein [Mycolicibacterium psychrotolerans]BBX69412.1 hypothetical protein MPSYJ_28730 [Mycolicibacterium psychrotolerans]